MRSYIWPLLAFFIMFNEIIDMFWSFYNKTLAFFSYENSNATYLFFLEYMSSILILLILFYLFFWIWGKISSPLVSVGKIMYDVISKFNISKIRFENKIWIFLLSLLVLISITFFTKYLFHDFSNREYKSIYQIVLDIISMWWFFYISYIFTNFINKATNDFIETEKWFSLIWFFTFFYISILWIFYSYMDYSNEFIVNFLIKLKDTFLN